MGYLRSRDLGVLMKLTASFNVLRNATSDMRRMHYFNYKLQKEATQDFWEKEFIDYPKILITNFTKVNINLRY
tara:strand:- start:299 stop:517 length:219 start_codon:yes stop_codon:yes gene_type:complete